MAPKLKFQNHYFIIIINLSLYYCTKKGNDIIQKREISLILYKLNKSLHHRNSRLFFSFELILFSELSLNQCVN